MKKQADFRQHKAQREKHLAEQFYSDQAYREVQLKSIKQFLRTNLQHQPDFMRKHKVETEYYDLLHRLAEENGGCVELDINEEFHYGTLTYWGNEFVIDTDFSPTIKQLAELIADSDTLQISMEKNFFKFQLSFDLTKKKIFQNSSQNF